VNGDPKRVRRVVSGVDDDGRSTVIHDGDPPTGMLIGEEDAPYVAMQDVWQTGGICRNVSQGGDADSYDLEPYAGGVKLLNLEMAPFEDTAEKGWHATATIDVDIIISGTVEMGLPDHAPVAQATSWFNAAPTTGGALSAMNRCTLFA
jgi:hypothetical protein